MRNHLRDLVHVGVLTTVAVLVASTSAQATPRPEVIPLPDGFAPEGIASGPGNSVYAGSLADGDVVRADLRTGAVEKVVDVDGRIAVGLKVNQRTNQLVVAGGPSGMAYVYDARTGAEIGAVRLTSQPSFINDVTLTVEGAWFTNSAAPELYFLPIGPDGSLGFPRTLSLSGPAAETPGLFNLNGIASSPDGSRLIVAHSALAQVILVDPVTGASETIDLDGKSVTNADGILLDGPRLWVVQNRLNQVAEIRLSPDYSSGTVVATRTDDDFDVPTTIARHGNRLAAVNARFGTPATPTTQYDIVVIPR